MSPIFPNATTFAGNFTAPGGYVQPPASEPVWNNYLVEAFGAGALGVALVMCAWKWKDRRAKKADKRAAKKAMELTARSAAAGIERAGFSAKQAHPMEERFGSLVTSHPDDLRCVVNVQTGIKSASTRTWKLGDATLSAVDPFQSDGASTYYTPHDSVTQLGDDSPRRNIVGTLEEADISIMGSSEPTHAEANNIA